MSISRVYRLLRLITMLQGRRSYTAGELAEELEVSRRTIFRDLNMLEMARIPYYYDPDSGGYKISRHFFLPAINLTITEALAILMLAGRMHTSRPLPLLSHGARAAVKVESALPPSIRQHVGSVIGGLSLSLGPVSAHQGLDSMFDELADAIAQKRVCRIVYISFHERRQITTRVNPLRLVFHSRAWYLIAYSAKHRENRTFKLGRIRKLAVTEKKFSRDKDVQAAEHFGDAWSMIPEGKLYDVHLHFAPKVAGNVAEVHWHNSQQVKWNDDGSIEFYATVDGLGEITWWVLGYGGQVRVVAPRRLRTAVMDAARRVLANHEEGSP